MDLDREVALLKERFEGHVKEAKIMWTHHDETAVLRNSNMVKDICQKFDERFGRLPCNSQVAKIDELLKDVKSIKNNKKWLNRALITASLAVAGGVTVWIFKELFIHAFT